MKWVKLFDSFQDDEIDDIIQDLIDTNDLIQVRGALLFSSVENDSKGIYCHYHQGILTIYYQCPPPARKGKRNPEDPRIIKLLDDIKKVKERASIIGIDISYNIKNSSNQNLNTGKTSYYGIISLVVGDIKTTYQKAFEELRPETYRSASDKLDKLGHKRRAKELKDWWEKRRIEEEVKLFKPNGVFNMNIFNYKYVHGGNSQYNFIMNGDFYIGFYVDFDWILDLLNDIKNLGSSLYIIFNMGIIPANEETKEKLLNIPDINNHLWNDGLWEQWIQIKLSEKGFEIIDRAEPSFYINDKFSYDCTNRKDARQLYNYINKLFSLEIDTRKFYNTDTGRYGFGFLRDLREVLEKESEDKLIWSKIIKSVERMSISYLFKD